MSFLHAQASLSWWEWTLRAVVAYSYLVLMVKLLGQRSLSQLHLLDFVTALLIGHMLALPLSDEKSEMFGPLITTLVVTLMHMAGAWFSLKSGVVRRFLEPRPVTLVKNGQINADGLRQARLSIDSLLSELRKNQAADVSQVALALWEPGGAISVFLQSPFAPATPTVLQLPAKPFRLPRVVVQEGRIRHQTLVELGKDEAWLRTALLQTAPGNPAEPSVEAAGVLLATLTLDGVLHVVKYHSSEF